MTPDDVVTGRAWVRALPCRPVVLGTFGLVLHGLLEPALAADVDVLCALEDAPAIAAALLQQGARVWSWKDPVTTTPTLDALRGRMYLRAEEGSVILDVTYEGLDRALWGSDTIDIDGLRVASVERILALKRKRGAEKDLRVLALVDEARKTE